MARLKHQEDWEIRKVQKHGNGYSRITIPREFAEGLEELRFKQTGDYIILNRGMQDDNEINLKMPTSLLRTGDEEIQEHLLSTILQSYCIPGVDKINLKVDLEQRDEFYEIFSKMSLPEYVVWHPDSMAFEFINDFGFEEYLNLVVEFVNNHFLELLSKDDIDDQVLFRYQILAEEGKAEIDKKWALNTRSTMEVFQNLEKPYFPWAFAVVYVSKYLELMTNHISKTVTALNELYSISPEAFFNIKEELYEVFIDGPERFDERVRDIAAWGTSKDIGSRSEDWTLNVKKQINITNQMQTELDELGSTIDKEGLENPVEVGKQIGKIADNCKEVVEVPRSIASAGLGANYLTNAM